MLSIDNRKGFTLIELLIVVSIIGILSVSLIPNLSGAPARARDAARKAALSEVATAIETFNIDYGRYPNTSGCVIPRPTSETTDLADIANTYLKGIPPTFDDHGAQVPGAAEGDPPVDANCPTSIQYTPISGGYILFTGLESGRGGNYDLGTLQGYDGTTTQATASTKVDPLGTGNAEAVIR